MTTGFGKLISLKPGRAVEAVSGIEPEVSVPVVPHLLEPANGYLLRREEN